jgi:hypothetical protein
MRGEIHETHSRIQFIRTQKNEDILGELDMDPFEK